MHLADLSKATYSAFRLYIFLSVCDMSPLSMFTVKNAYGKSWL